MTIAMRDLRFVTADQLTELGRRDGVVVVAFLATWNLRCQDFCPSYKSFAERWSSTISVVCVDVDELSALTATFDVCSIPTIVLLKAGKEICREVGLDLRNLDALLESGC